MRRISSLLNRKEKLIGAALPADFAAGANDFFHPAVDPDAIASSDMVSDNESIFV